MATHSVGTPVSDTDRENPRSLFQSACPKDSRLRIGIDIHSVGSQQGGNETYFQELTRRLIELPCAHEWVLYYTNAAARERFSSDGRVTLERLRPRHPLLRIPLTVPWRTREDRLDVFHAQHIVPPFLKCKTVTTIPDIAYEHFPEAFPRRERAWLKRLIRDSANRANHIITVSEYSKRDIVQTYGIPEDKVTVTYEGAGQEFRPGDKRKAREEAWAKVRDYWGIRSLSWKTAGAEKSDKSCRGIRKGSAGGIALQACFGWKAGFSFRTGTGSHSRAASGERRSAARVPSR